LKKPNSKKKPIKTLKKPTGSVRFQFYKPKTEKTEPNQTEKNRAKPKKPSHTKKTESKPSQTGFGSVSIFL